MLGFLIGSFNKPLADTLAPLGELYLVLLGMCVLPIIVTALISSVGKSLQTKYIASLIKHFIIFLLGGLIIASILSILIAELANSSLDISAAIKSVLNNKATQTGSSTLTETKGTSDILSFISQIIPANIFHALSQGHTLSIVLFSILLGTALGSIKTMEAKKLSKLCMYYFQHF